ncbi:hypothetical protein OPKNFCMD_6290 [Methylobacterium crusticola]|uniref:Tetratricopeptide repeat protein n=1 Tax=Methylobacterium crusticola TaxID=1697972 RepID=A0ABQ4R8S8_9HYPH|nr:hypothetical protein [Methylobacterium crusticola]GJD53514.1 hypothetical protein OPKNFCMD_6290 [Methylobacterium crusticola]
MWHASDTASRPGRHRAANRAAVLLLTTCMVPGGLAAAEGAGHRVATDGRPYVSARNVAGEAGVPIRLDIEVVPPSDRPFTSTYLLGLPAGARVTDTTHTVAAAGEEAAIEVTRWNLPELVITLQPGQVGTFVMRVAAMTDAVDGGVQQVVSSGFTVSAEPPDPDAPGPVLRAAARTLVAALPQGPVPHVPGPGPDATVPPDTKPLRTGSPAAVSPKVLPPNTGPADAPRPAASRPAPPASPPMHPPPAAAPPVAIVEPGAAALVGRAEDLIRRGDISGARLVLERALSRNEPRAALLLAQTYDPNVLRTWKVRGLRPDPERAQSLYARAAGDKAAEPTSLAAFPR